MPGHYGEHGVNPDVNVDLLNQHLTGLQDNLEQYKKTQQEEEAAASNATQIENQALAKQKDPRNKEKWGLGAVTKELQSVISGGLQDTASSIVTFPERTLDMVNGEMAKAGADYRPDWDPFTDYDNPIETRTWWGKLLRGTVHFGSLAVVPIAGQRALGFKVANSFVRAAGIGAVSDLISKESDGHNALGAMRDAYGFVDTPLSTKEGDHPVMMKVKNILEGMGIGAAFDGASILLGKGSKKALAKVRARNKSIEDQTVEAGIEQIKRGDKGFRADKNKPIADRHQSAHISKEDAYDARQNLKRTRTDYGAEEGSTGSVTTPVQREKASLPNATYDEKVITSVLKDLKSSEAFDAEVRGVKAGQFTMEEKWGDAIAQHQRTVLGRNAAEMPAKEYLYEFFQNSNVFEKGTKDEIVSWTEKNIVAADLVVGSLLKQLRDTGIAGREIADFANLGDIDAPAKQVLDTMLTAMQEIKRSRLTMSDAFAGMTPAKRKKAIADALKSDMDNSKDALSQIIQLASRDKDDDLMKGLFETISSVNDVNNLDDIDAWARKMVLGGDIDGKVRTGELIKELQTMMIHSILSGPKTAIRAMMGTSTATFIRPLSTAIGATMRYPFSGDSTTIRASLASMNAMMQALPESFKLFKNRLNSYWSGDIATVKTRFAETSKGDVNWELVRRWAESDKANAGEKASFYLANMARNANNNSLFTYSTKLMAATDDSFSYILGRAKMREKAFRSAADAQSAGRLADITPDLLKKYENDFYSDVFDANGSITDKATDFARREVTLTQDLTGFSKGLNEVFNATPWAKPFFLFARTGVNGLALTAKHTPGFNFLVKEFNDIAFANPNTLADVHKYGIFTPEELANAKALQTGRLGMGTAMVSMATWSWMSGNLTGNGPTDRAQRKVWMDGGYKPRSIKIGDVWVGYDSIEPFNQIFNIIADVGDHQQLMGDEWVEKQLLSTSLVIAQGIASKSYLQGMQQFVDLFAGNPGQPERIVGNIANNTLPLAGLRNEIGKILTPYTRELGSGIDQAVRNRNLAFEGLPGSDLPIKYDILTGRPIKEHDFITRTFNAISPVSFNLDHSPGRQFLFDSGYDLRTSTYYSPDGVNLTDSPDVRSLFQKAIGDQNLERELDKMAADPKMIASLNEMNQKIKNGERGEYESIDFAHNRKLKILFTRARQKAWAKIKNEPAVQRLIQNQRQSDIKRYQIKKKGLNDYSSVLNMYK